MTPAFSMYEIQNLSDYNMPKSAMTLSDPDIILLTEFLEKYRRKKKLHGLTFSHSSKFWISIQGHKEKYSVLENQPLYTMTFISKYAILMAH